MSDSAEVAGAFAIVDAHQHFWDPIVHRYPWLDDPDAPRVLEGQAALAACPNASIKISGLGQRGPAWTAATNGAIVRTIIDLFGVERCMFASNFPVDSLCGTFPAVFGGFREIVGDLSATEQRLLFRDNAIRIHDMR